MVLCSHLFAYWGPAPILNSRCTASKLASPPPPLQSVANKWERSSSISSARCENHHHQSISRSPLRPVFTVFTLALAARLMTCVYFHLVRAAAARMSWQPVRTSTDLGGRSPELPRSNIHNSTIILNKNTIQQRTFEQIYNSTRVLLTKWWTQQYSFQQVYLNIIVGTIEQKPQSMQWPDNNFLKPLMTFTPYPSHNWSKPWILEPFSRWLSPPIQATTIQVTIDPNHEFWRM